MYFEYNYKKNNWRLTKDISNHHGFYLSNSRLIARFENLTEVEILLLKETKRPMVY